MEVQNRKPQITQNAHSVNFPQRHVPDNRVQVHKNEVLTVSDFRQKTQKRQQPSSVRKVQFSKISLPNLIEIKREEHLYTNLRVYL